MCDIFWKGSFQHEKWPWDYDKWGALTCTFPSYNRLCSSWDSRLSASCNGAPVKLTFFPNWPSEGMINCLEVASCQLACDLCSLCSNHLWRTYTGLLVHLLVLFILITVEKEQGQGFKGLMLKLAPELPAHSQRRRFIDSSSPASYNLQLWAGLQESNKTPNTLTCLGVVIGEPLLVRLRRVWEARELSEQLLCFLLTFLDIKQVIGILISFYKRGRSRPQTCWVCGGVFCSSLLGAGQLSLCCLARHLSLIPRLLPNSLTRGGKNFL